EGQFTGHGGVDRVRARWRTRRRPEVHARLRGRDGRRHARVTGTLRPSSRLAPRTKPSPAARAWQRTEPSPVDPETATDKQEVSDETDRETHAVLRTGGCGLRLRFGQTPVRP